MSIQPFFTRLLVPGLLLLATGCSTTVAVRGPVPPPPPPPATVVYHSRPVPPPLIVEEYHPRPHFVWIRGHWRWNGYRYVWARGHYRPV